MTRKNKFKRLFLQYGAYIINDLYEIALKKELYEDCDIIKEVFNEYNISPLYLDFEDYRTEFWQLGFSGNMALNNYPYYLQEAKELVGYE